MSRFARLFSSRTPPRRRLIPNTDRRRRLSVEQLEGRQLLAADLLSSAEVTHRRLGLRDSSPDMIRVSDVLVADAELAPSAVAERATAESENILAFPGAEGFGRFARGGRGGDVYHVTSLHDDGPGSLRHGVQSAVGPRTIVFDVSGTITLESVLRIDKPYLTIAGHTAPGDGIAVRNFGTAIVNTHDIIIRYMRFRPGDTVKREHDALLIFGSENVIIDHSSLSWAVDENLDVTNSRNVTVQWSIISEGLNKSHHSKGKHSSGSLQANSNVSYHHNLFASNNSRNPLIQQQADVVNNVFYNYGHWGALIGSSGGRDPLGKTQVNLQNNYYIAGPSTDLVGPLEGRMVRLFEQAKLWMSGNLLDTNKDGVLNGVLADERNVEFHDTGGTPNGVLKPRRFDFPEVETTDAKTAYHQVLADAGASLARDGVDNRLVNQVTQQTGKIINSQKKVGAWPELVSGQLQRDQDGDGLPDAWELQHGMDPRDPSDARADSNADGHTNLEEYHNEIAR